MINGGQRNLDSLCYYLGILSGKNKFITGSAPRLEVFRIVSLAEEPVIVDTVGEVDQELVACGAREASWMPKVSQSESGGHDRQVPAGHGGLALATARGVPIVVGHVEIFGDDHRVAHVESYVIPGTNKVLERALVSLADMLALLEGQVLLW